MQLLYFSFFSFNCNVSVVAYFKFAGLERNEADAKNLIDYTGKTFVNFKLTKSLWYCGLTALKNSYEYFSSFEYFVFICFFLFFRVFSDATRINFMDQPSLLGFTLIWVNYLGYFDFLFKHSDFYFFNVRLHFNWKTKLKLWYLLSEYKYITYILIWKYFIEIYNLHKYIVIHSWLTPWYPFKLLNSIQKICRKNMKIINDKGKWRDNIIFCFW